MFISLRTHTKSQKHKRLLLIGQYVLLQETVHGLNSVIVVCLGLYRHFLKKLICNVTFEAAGQWLQLINPVTSALKALSTFIQP